MSINASLGQRVPLWLKDWRSKVESATGAPSVAPVADLKELIEKQEDSGGTTKKKSSKWGKKK